MDHLVFGVPDLAQGIELVERCTGVRARFGGQHPGRGTHNALLSLGGRQYLEIIAMDPDQHDAPGLLFPALEGLAEPKLIAWAVAVESVADVAKRAQAAGIETIGPLDGSRAQSDGSLLTWKTLRIDSPVEGVPFFIEWHAGAAHPSQASPSGCRLTSFEIEHPDPQQLRGVLKNLGADEAILTPASRVRLRARLQTPKGEVELG
jgi:Glyoxalase-like domain